MLKKLYGKMVNPETVSYLIFGVLTTAVDWIVYPISRWLSLIHISKAVCQGQQGQQYTVFFQFQGRLPGLRRKRSHRF